LDEALAAVDNVNQNVSGGIRYESSNEYIVRGVMSETHPEIIGKALVKMAVDKPVLLEHIADIQIGSKAPKIGLASEKTKSAVLLTVTKQPNTGTIALTDKLDEAVEEFRKTLPT